MITENTAKKYIASFTAKNGEQVLVYQLEKGDFDDVWSFYKAGIANLANKADFYPYKKSEILSILSGEGVFLGGFMDGELAGLCAIDFDEGYQEGIKKANASFPNFPFSDGLLEFSGLFVAEKFRKLGIAEKMSEILLDIGKKVRPSHRLFAVVLESNVASMKNFFALGFKLFGWWQMDEEYKFVYLISKGEKEIGKPLKTQTVSVSQIVEKLEKGAVFHGVTKSGELICEAE